MPVSSSQTGPSSHSYKLEVKSPDLSTSGIRCSYLYSNKLPPPGERRQPGLDVHFALWVLSDQECFLHQAEGRLLDSRREGLQFHLRIKEYRYADQSDLPDFIGDHKALLLRLGRQEGYLL